MQRKYEDALGKPAFEIEGLRVWVHGRQYPDAQTFWDGNWWRTTILCSSENSSVKVSGDVLHGSEVGSWLTELEQVREGHESSAHMDTMEPYLEVEIRPETYQRFSVRVNITPDHVFEKHYFEFWCMSDEIDKLIAGCRHALQQFPLVGTH
jgi:hypothetical protein